MLIKIHFLMQYANDVYYTIRHNPIEKPVRETDESSVWSVSRKRFGRKQPKSARETDELPLPSVSRHQTRRTAL